MRKKLCDCMVGAIIATIYAEKAPEYIERRTWQEIYSGDDYAELVCRIRRWYDKIGEISNVDVVIERILIWDDDNNNMAIETDYRQLCKALNEKKWINCTYEYEPNDNDRLLKLFEQSITH